MVGWVTTSFFIIIIFNKNCRRAKQCWMSMWREWPEYPDSRTTFKACKNSFLQAFTVLRSTSIPRIMPLRYRRISYHQVCNLHSSPFPVPPQWHWHTSKFWVSRFFFFKSLFEHVEIFTRLALKVLVSKRQYM